MIKRRINCALRAIDNEKGDLAVWARARFKAAGRPTGIQVLQGIFASF